MQLIQIKAGKKGRIKEQMKEMEHKSQDRLRHKVSILTLIVNYVNTPIKRKDCQTW